MDWTASAPTNYVPVGTNVQFRAYPCPAGVAWPNGKPVWKGVDTSTIATASQIFADPGFYDVTAECGNVVTAKMAAVWIDLDVDANYDGKIDDADDPRCEVLDRHGKPNKHGGANETALNMSQFSAELAVPKVDRIEYKWGTMDWTASVPTNYVPVGTNVQFHALPQPSDAAWPENRPVWSGASAGTDDRATSSQTFADPNFYDVIAECGNVVTAKMCAVEMEVTNIKFNHNHGSTQNDAINIRKDFEASYDVSNGEWVKDGVNHPFCYTTAQATS